MNEKIAQGMIDKMAGIDLKTTYGSLKSKEEKLVEQLRVVREEIANIEIDIIKEKLDTAIKCLIDVDKMSGGYYRCSIETYCENCEEEFEIDIDLAKIIEVLQQIR